MACAETAEYIYCSADGRQVKMSAFLTSIETTREPVLSTRSCHTIRYYDDDDDDDDGYYRAWLTPKTKAGATIQLDVEICQILEMC